MIASRPQWVCRVALWRPGWTMICWAMVAGAWLGLRNLPEPCPAAEAADLSGRTRVAERPATWALASAESASKSRPAQWAQPIQLEGVPNLHKVSDQLYRSAQPTAEGMRKLKKLGIKTVVNLRSSHSDADELAQTDLAYEHIPMRTWSYQEDGIVRFLRIVTDPEKTPVLVHCQHGADRTGTVCAVYRIVVQGWSKQEAIKEMTEGGFGFHQIWFNLVRYVNELDADKLKQKLKDK